MISNPVFGVWVFVFVDIMFFAALSSSYYVIRKGRVDWAIPGAIDLPVGAAGFNALVLLVSAVLLFLAIRMYSKTKNQVELLSALARVGVVGGAFLAFQIFLSARLVMAGLTMKSSIFGACYYLLVGSHAVHVLGGLLVLASMIVSKERSFILARLRALQIYWFFVVGVWPLLYVQIYF